MLLTSLPCLPVVGSRSTHYCAAFVPPFCTEITAHLYIHRGHFSLVDICIGSKTLNIREQDWEAYLGAGAPCSFPAHGCKEVLDVRPATPIGSWISLHWSKGYIPTKWRSHGPESLPIAYKSGEQQDLRAEEPIHYVFQKYPNNTAA